jgi:hypothetical protein
VISAVRQAAARLGTCSSDDLRAETGLPRESVDVAITVLTAAGYLGLVRESHAESGEAASRPAHCRGCPLVERCSGEGCPTAVGTWTATPRYALLSRGGRS